MEIYLSINQYLAKKAISYQAIEKIVLIIAPLDSNQLTLFNNFLFNYFHIHR